MKRIHFLLITVVLACALCTSCNVWPAEPQRIPVPWPKELLPDDLPEMQGDVMSHSDNPDELYICVRTNKASLDDFLVQLAECGYTVDDTKTSPTAQKDNISIEFQWQGKKDVGIFLVRSEPIAPPTAPEPLPSATPIPDHGGTVTMPASSPEPPTLQVKDIALEGWIMKDDTPLKNTKGETVQTLSKAEIVGIEEIDGETYWLEYGGEFLQVSAESVSVRYDTVYYGEALHETYGYSFELAEIQYRVTTFAEGSKLSVIGRSGNFYHIEMDDGSQVNVPAQDLSVSRN